MKTQLTASLLFPALISAHIEWQPQVTPFSPAPTPSHASPSEQTPAVTTMTSPSTPTPTESHVWDPIISGASHLLDEIDEHFHVDLKKRQGAVGATYAIPATTVATQMPSVTVYNMKSLAPMTYTQIFVAVLDQWPSPSVGTIGLGTIQGQIGVVKTHSKRAAVAWHEPTPAATPGQVLRIKGREVTMS